ncbi:Small ubiquitin-related modifier 1 [Elasticomyces elasticus]|nr:Small ubiquitin-related modifier 1 [Elasticomyces elasticus]KAK3647175.1 Small ubiquitin-related modifier 1 [Elasticomyces elasticus]KAK4918611.1 Small ubiquitin-related modifier 1 [Elasticomyces elasticus]KAK5756131.1 Small ubiquitin-related modifier 1 [Elasticomyces elasticus]
MVTFSDCSSPTLVDTSDEVSVISKRDSWSDFDSMHIDVHEATLKKNRYVNVVIRDHQDRTGPGMRFKVKYLDTFKNAFDHFQAASCKVCKPVSEMRFKRDGEVVLPTQTPKKLDLWHDSTTVIHVYYSVSGLSCSSCKGKGYPKSDGVIKPGTPAPVTLFLPSKVDVVSLAVEDQTGFRMSIKVLSTGSMEALMAAYATKAMRERNVLRFFFDGERLSPKETPKQLGLIDNDLITVFIEQLGG